LISKKPGDNQFLSPGLHFVLQPKDTGTTAPLGAVGHRQMLKILRGAAAFPPAKNLNELKVFERIFQCLLSENRKIFC
jgi:hypothetical protein